MTAGLVGVPLHIVDGLDILHSFGMETGAHLRADRGRVLAGSLIATGRHDALLEAFAGDGLAIENVDSELQYHPRMVIWRLDFNPFAEAR